jgi:hypothetical protein
VANGVPDTVKLVDEVITELFEDEEDADEGLEPVLLFKLDCKMEDEMGRGEISFPLMLFSFWARLVGVKLPFVFEFVVICVCVC